MLLLCKLNHEQFFSIGESIHLWVEWSQSEKAEQSKTLAPWAKWQSSARSANARATPGWTASLYLNFSSGLMDAAACSNLSRSLSRSEIFSVPNGEFLLHQKLYATEIKVDYSIIVLQFLHCLSQQELWNCEVVHLVVIWESPHKDYFWLNTHTIR